MFDLINIEENSSIWQCIFENAAWKNRIFIDCLAQICIYTLKPRINQYITFYNPFETTTVTNPSIPGTIASLSVGTNRVNADAS
jgi:hypothetical protein